MMQLPGESLVQYEDLEILLDNFTPPSLPESNWPLFATNNAVSATKISPPGTASSSEKGGTIVPDGSSDSGTGSGVSGSSPSGGQSIDRDIRGLW